MADLIITNPGGGDIADANGELISGSFSPTTGYVGVPLPFVDLVDVDGTEVASFDGFVVSEAVLQNPNLIAGLLPFFVVSIDAIELATEDTITIRASDLGYRSDTPVVSFPPILQEGFSIDARIPLAPSQVGIVWGWGTLTLVNDDGDFDEYVEEWDIDGRSISIQYGVKTWDDSRGIFLDPLLSDMSTVFTGVGTSWLLSEYLLDVPLRDASYWLDRPLQHDLYAGTGTYEGDTELAEIPKPVTRGKVFNIPLFLIDRINLIYQYNNGPGTVVALYEGAATNIIFQADTTDLYTGSTAPGNYRTDNSRGLIQLGLEPVDSAPLTADVVGHFPVAGAQTVAANIARYIMSEDMEIPSNLLDVDSFSAIAASYPYEAGWYWGPNERVDGAAALGQCMAAMGTRIVPGADGALGCIILRAVTGGDTAVAEYTTASIISCKPRQLPAEVSPPAHRIRSAYQHNYTVQTDGILGSASVSRRQFVQTEDRFVTWSDTGVSDVYVNSNDILPFGGGLTTEVNAQAVVDRFGALWGVRRFLWDVEIPLIEGIAREFGDIVNVTYPVHSFTSGANCMVVGRSVNTREQIITLTVLL